MTVCYPGAGSVAAVLFGVFGNVIRLALDGWDDIAEFRLVDGQWFSEEDERVNIESSPEPWCPEELGEPPCLLVRVCPAPAAAAWVN